MNKRKDDDIITKYVVISSDSVLPIDAALKVYGSEQDITIKETCFGTMVTGPRAAVNKVVDEVRSMDKNHIFVKERGYLAGDERRCRSSRGGGARPGFYYLKEEVELLPTIGDALDDYDKNVKIKTPVHAQKLNVKKLKEIAETNV